MMHIKKGRPSHKFAQHRCIIKSQQFVPYSRGWLDWRGTPHGQLLSLLLAQAQKHPGLWWWCLPRTGPRIHHLWLLQAVKNVYFSVPIDLIQMSKGAFNVSDVWNTIP